MIPLILQLECNTFKLNENNIQSSAVYRHESGDTIRIATLVSMRYTVVRSARRYTGIFLCLGIE